MDACWGLASASIFLLIRGVYLVVSSEGSADDKEKHTKTQSQEVN